MKHTTTNMHTDSLTVTKVGYNFIIFEKRTPDSAQLQSLHHFTLPTRIPCTISPNQVTLLHTASTMAVPCYIVPGSEQNPMLLNSPLTSPCHHCIICDPSQHTHTTVHQTSRCPLPSQQMAGQPLNICCPHNTYVTGEQHYRELPSYNSLTNNTAHRNTTQLSTMTTEYAELLMGSPSKIRM
jgi:hypothetical protein